MKNRKQINFFKNYYDIAKELQSNGARLEWYDTIMKIQFLEVHIDDIDIKNKELKILFISIKHSLYSSVEGYCNRMKIDYASLFCDANEGGSEGGSKGGSEQEEEQEEEQEKPFSFVLQKETSVYNISSEYKYKLREHIEKSEYSLSYEDFINGLEAKGNKYKNFKSAYTTWAKNHDKWNKDDVQKDKPRMIL